jgi:hypothetical protein
MKNKITDLRNHLFETLEGLLDKEEPLEIERAKAVADVAQVLVNSAKIEVEYLKVMGSNVEDTGFIKPKKELKP